MSSFIKSLAKEKTVPVWLYLLRPMTPSKIQAMNNATRFAIGAFGGILAVQATGFGFAVTDSEKATGIKKNLHTFFKYALLLSGLFTSMMMLGAALSAYRFSRL